MFDKDMHLKNLNYKKQRECKICCSCHNVCIYGECQNRSMCPHRFEMSHFLDFNDTCNEIQKIKNGSIRLSNCSSVAVTPGGSNPSCQLEVRCLECNTAFHVYLFHKGHNKSNEVFCQKQNSNKERSKKRSYSAEGSMGSIYAKSLPSSMRLLFERQEIDSDTFGFTMENEFEADSDTEFYGSDFQISNCDEDQDYDIMFSNSSESIVEGYTNLGRYMLDANSIGCLIDV